MLRSVQGLDKSERRYLEQLNFGSVPEEPVSKTQIDALINSGLIEEGVNGRMSITVQGQLALARDRFRDVPKLQASVAPAIKRRSFWHRMTRKLPDEIS